MSVASRLNPRLAIATSPDNTIGVSCMSHHVSSTKTMGGNVPSTIYLVKTTILPSQLYGFEKEGARLSIPYKACICRLYLLTQTTSAGLSLKVILANMDNLSTTAYWYSYFIRSKIFIKDTVDRSVWRTISTSANVWVVSGVGGAVGVSAWPLVSGYPHVGPPDCDFWTIILLALPGVLDVTINGCYLEAGAVVILPWPT